MPAKMLGRGSRCVAPSEWIKHEVARLSKELNEEVRQANWYACRMGRQAMILAVPLILIHRLRVAELKQIRRRIIGELECIGWYGAFVILKKRCGVDVVLRWPLA